MASLATIVPFGFGYEPAAFLEGIAPLGCTTCQFYRNQKADEPDLAHARRTIEQAGLRFDSIHGVFGEDIDPSSPDPSERDRCLKIYDNEARVALELHAPMVVVHPARFNDGRQFLDPETAHREQESRWRHLDDFLERLAEIGESRGVMFLIENQPRNCPLGHNPAALAERVARVGSARIRMCFDTGHANLTGDVVESLGRCADAVEYLHIHDNDGADDHRWPGDGSIDWDRLATVMHAIDAPRMLEVFREGPAFESLRDAQVVGAIRARLAL